MSVNGEKTKQGQVSSESKDTEKSRGSREITARKQSREIVESRGGIENTESEENRSLNVGKSNEKDDLKSKREGVDDGTVRARVQPAVRPSFENGRVGEALSVEPMVQTADEKTAKPIKEPPKDRYTYVLKYFHCNTTVTPL
jgi:hypothetical protein